jgi:very-short-patch-repair endonuclease
VVNVVMAASEGPPSDVAVARLAARQDGVASRAQLGHLGFTARQIDRRVAAGRLIAIYRGVYAVGHAALTERGRVRAALLAAGPTAVASHLTAARLWELIRSMPDTIEVTVAGRARRSRDGLLIHETTREPEVRRRDGLPLTAPLRTLIDLAATQPAELVDRAAAEALVRRLVTDRQLQDAGLTAPAPTRSELERAFLKIVTQAGLPRPLVNHRIGPYEVDFVWPDHHLIVETDGWAAHGHRRAFERDRARDAALQAAGFRVVRFTYRQIHEQPLRVAAQLARLLHTGSVLA